MRSHTHTGPTNGTNHRRQPERDGLFTADVQLVDMRHFLLFLLLSQMKTTKMTGDPPWTERREILVKREKIDKMRDRKAECGEYECVCLSVYESAIWAVQPRNQLTSSAVSSRLSSNRERKRERGKRGDG